MSLYTTAKSSGQQVYIYIYIYTLFQVPCSTRTNAWGSSNSTSTKYKTVVWVERVSLLFFSTTLVNVD